MTEKELIIPSCNLFSDISEATFVSTYIINADLNQNIGITECIFVKLVLPD